MPDFRSLAGGFFSADPNDHDVPVSIRMNNPGAVNGAPWERGEAGYLGEVETTPGNRSSLFETPEHGVAVWYELMGKYRAEGVVTVGGIINRYGGGQNYSVYAAQVEQWTGFAPNREIPLTGGDATLLAFAKAMFHYEAGRPTPLADAQILYGFELARQRPPAPGPVPIPPAPAPMPVPPPRPPVSSPGLWGALLNLFIALFVPRRKPVVTARYLKLGDFGADVEALQRRLVALGYHDLVVDGSFGPVTAAALRSFQSARNLDPDGEAGPLTIAELNRDGAAKPPLLPPAAKYGPAPPWYANAASFLGFHEVGVNRGIEQFIALAQCGQLGDSWCAIFQNAMLEKAGFHGTRSAAARSFENDPADFVRLGEPALGAIVTMWRGSPASGQGHVFLYDGESASGVRGIGANEDDMVKRSFHERRRIVGYYWPRSAPLPNSGRIAVGDGTTSTKET